MAVPLTNRTNPARVAFKRAQENLLRTERFYRANGIGTDGGEFRRLYEQARISYKISSGRPTAIREISQDFLGNLRPKVERQIAKAQDMGLEFAQNQYDAYGLTPQLPPTTDKQEQARSEIYVNAVMAQAERQVRQVEASALTNTSPEDELFGDFLVVGAVLLGLAAWGLSSIYDVFFRTIPPPGALKVAVAVLDNKTTWCCLDVHGQVQPFDQPFITTSPPAWRDQQEAPPFHYYCRTQVALYLPTADNNGIALYELQSLSSPVTPPIAT